MRDASPRMLKVNSTLREVLAEEIERMSDSRLEMVSVTGVETSPNLRHAVVYIDVLGADRHRRPHMPSIAPHTVSNPSLLARFG